MQQRLNNIYRKVINIIEHIIAALTLLVLVGLTVYEIYKMFTVNGYFESADIFLKNILTVVVGLEFVRMLIKLTLGNIIEVLIVAMARQVLINHGGPWENIACVLCLAGLFAIRRFLVEKRDLNKDITVEESEEDTEKTEISVL